MVEIVTHDIRTADLLTLAQRTCSGWREPTAALFSRG